MPTKITDLPTGNMPGRKSQDTNTAIVRKTLNEAAKYAVQRLFYNIRGYDHKGRKVKPLSGTMLKACELSISYAIGLPRQMVDLRVEEVLTLRDLSRLAFEDIKQLPEPDITELIEPIIEGEYAEANPGGGNQLDSTQRPSEDKPEANQ